MTYNTCITFWQGPHPFYIWIQMHRIYQFSRRFQTIFWLYDKLKCKYTTRNTLYSYNLRVLFLLNVVWSYSRLKLLLLAILLSFSNRPKQNPPKLNGLCSKLNIKPLAKALTKKCQLSCWPFFFSVSANKFAFCLQTSCTEPLHF